jgi:hypothetical protein
VVGLRFPDGGSDLFLQNNPEIKMVEVEIIVDDVREACIQLKEKYHEVEFYREPFQAGEGHIAVVKVSRRHRYRTCWKIVSIRLIAYSPSFATKHL